jgi:Domain of unknown function (DUF4293)
MIQRIQSIWLLLASVAAFLTLKVPFFSGNQLDTVTNTKQFVLLNAMSSIWLLILAVAVGVASLVALFLFKDRKRQLLVVSAIAVVALLNIVLYFSETKHFAEGNINLTSLLAFSIPLWLALALRGIWKDEQLVKSTNRLR